MDTRFHIAADGTVYDVAYHDLPRKPRARFVVDSKGVVVDRAAKWREFRQRWLLGVC